MKYMATTQAPLITQYEEMKKKHPDAILLFRVGDFYETFCDDAVAVSEILGVTLTRRSYDKAKSMELTVFPHHALDTYLPKLVRAGKRVAICEQLENPKIAKNTPQLPSGQEKRPNGLIIGRKERLDSLEINTTDGRFMIHKDRVGIFIQGINTGDWFFAPLILSPEDEARYKLYTQLSWKYSEWIWVDEYGEDEDLVQYYKELKELYSKFVTKFGYLNSPLNAAFIQKDAYSDNLEILEREILDTNGDKTYTRGRGFDEIEKRVKEIINPQIDFSSLFSLLTLMQVAIGQLYKLAEIRQKTAEIRALAHDLRISPRIAFKACYDEIVKIPMKSLFDTI